MDIFDWCLETVFSKWVGWRISPARPEVVFSKSFSQVWRLQVNNFFYLRIKNFGSCLEALNFWIACVTSTVELYGNSIREIQRIIVWKRSQNICIPGIVSTGTKTISARRRFLLSFGIRDTFPKRIQARTANTLFHIDSKQWDHPHAGSWRTKKVSAFVLELVVPLLSLWFVLLSCCVLDDCLFWWLAVCVLIVSHLVPSISVRSFLLLAVFCETFALPNSFFVSMVNATYCFVV